jgi:FkbM family methyltransferase
VGHSQFGEHLDIEEIVGTKIHGYAVDVGACDGVSLSNTKQLEDRGWDVLCIEANPRFAEALHNNRKRVMMLACGRENLDNQEFTVFEVQPGNFEAISALKPVEDRPFHRDATAKEVVRVGVRTLDWCLERSGFTRLDVASIDVEGGEQDVLDGFDIARWNPDIVVIEDWLGGTFDGWFYDRGYKNLRRRGVNEVFVRG